MSFSLTVIQISVGELCTGKDAENGPAFRSHLGSVQTRQYEYDAGGTLTTFADRRGSGNIYAYDG